MQWCNSRAKAAQSSHTDHDDWARRPLIIVVEQAQRKRKHLQHKLYSAIILDWCVLSAPITGTGIEG